MPRACTIAYYITCRRNRNFRRQHDRQIGRLLELAWKKRRRGSSIVSRCSRHARILCNEDKRFCTKTSLVIHPSRVVGRPRRGAVRNAADLTWRPRTRRNVRKTQSSKHPGGSPRRRGEVSKGERELKIRWKLRSAAIITKRARSGASGGLKRVGAATHALVSCNSVSLLPGLSLPRPLLPAPPPATYRIKPAA